jgi:hypothetical protein
MNGSAPSLRGLARDLLFLRTPALWTTWPFLPLMRRRPGQEEENGVVYDFQCTSGRTGYSSTVCFSNVFQMPHNEDEIIALPHETFDTTEEIVNAGWHVD